MRIILSIIFIFLILLIRIEDFVNDTFDLAKATFKALRRKIKTNRHAKQILKINKLLHKRTFYQNLAYRLKLVLKQLLVRKKRRKPIQISHPYRSKVKYFFFGAFFSFFVFFLPLVVLIFLQDLPSPRELSLRQIPQTTKIFDRNHILLSEIYLSQDRTLITLSDVPTSLQHATLAIEDKNFYKHPGFDIPSIFRAFRETVTRKNTQGGSTLTQQLIKSSILTPEQSLSRKMKELVLAFWAERIYTKNQILEMYFNQVPYGGTAWGVEAASERYFSKSVKKLSLSESAFLAGLTAAPSYYSPYGNHPKAWKGRQKEVLKRMVAVGYISQKEADQAAKEPLQFQRQQVALHAPHFVDYMKDILVNKYGIGAVEKGGLNVITSLDLKKQEMAQKVVAEEVAGSTGLDLTNGAALITDPKNGDILAMVGSHDFDDPQGGNVNLATSLRQPGSSIKVVTYSAALSHGVTAATMIDDSPVSYPGDSGPYSPVNYDGKFHGRVSIRTALANSLNIPAVKLLDAVGIPTMVNLGKDMGISSWGDANQYGLSLTLGAGEVTMLDMAHVYGTLANDGRREELNPILKITDTKGTILEEKKPNEGKKVLEKGISFILSDILADNQARAMEFGPNSPLLIPGHFVSVKTGTTDSKRDNWTDGYTKDYVVIVWVGNNDNHPMSQTLASGITGAAPIWHKIMATLLGNKPNSRPSLPAEVVAKSCFGKTEYFLKGTEEIANCNTPGRPTSTYSSR